MAENNLTIFQRLSNAFRGGTNRNVVTPDVVTTSPYNQSERDRVLYTTNDRADYERKLATLKQQKYLSYQWKKAESSNAMDSLAGYNAVRLMYRDADLMDGTCEIGTALDIIAEEACPLNSKGVMLNIKSSSKRVKSLLEDLFTNRLHIYTELPMIARELCKYGNSYTILNINADHGIMGWMLVPPYEVDRIENGYSASYMTSFLNGSDIKPDEIKFVRRGTNGEELFDNFQVAHFRLLNDSFFLPYGVSMLHKARRAWRMWSMMEDAMLIWRLDKAIERRVYKIYVGGIDDSDVPAYIDEIANRFKRTQIIDPATGQIDLRKNFLDVSSDYFIPVRREDAPNPIETLQAANSQVQMEDVEYMQNKMLTALRVPKTFLNFQDAQGKAQNLSFVDIRFARMINRVQQFLLMELNKIAMIHLMTMGMDDEIGNFSLSLNNPTSQIESQELDDLVKRLNAMQTALADPGNGIPMLSAHKAYREILKMSDSEIKDMLNEIRLEKALAAELQTTAMVIKKTGMFDSVDRLYGDYDAMMNPNLQQAAQQGEDGMMGGGGMGGLGGGMGDLGGDLGGDEAFGGPMGDESDLGGETDEMGMESAPAADNGGNIMEYIYGKNKKAPISEQRTKAKSFLSQYFDLLSESAKKDEEATEEVYDFDERNVTLQEQVNKIFNRIEKLVDEDSMERENIIKEAIGDAESFSGTQETKGKRKKKSE